MRLSLVILAVIRRDVETLIENNEGTDVEPEEVSRWWEQQERDDALELGS